MDNKTVSVKLVPELEGYEQAKDKINELCQLLERANNLIEEISSSELSVKVRKSQN